VLATYASTVKDRSNFIRRTQSLTKISSVGLGVIYYWHWGWASMPTQKSYSTNDEAELKEAAEGKGGPGFRVGGKSSDASKDKLYGRFMYLGLTVQNPTMTRINAHLKDAYSSGGIGKNSKANALYQAIVPGASAFNDGIIRNPEAIPNVLHLASWFDLDNLEAYYIQTKFKLGNPAAKTFGEQIQNSSVANTSDGMTLGVNTAGGGQGGTFKQDKDRGIAEWVSAAYYFLKEQDSEILASRPNDVSNIPTEAKKFNTLAEQVKYVFDAFSKIEVNSSVGKSKLVIPSLIKLFASYSVNTIRTYLDAMGLKDGVDMPRGSGKTLSEAQIVAELEKGGYSTQDMMDKVGKMFDTLFSFETNTKDGKGIRMFLDKQNPDTNKALDKRETFVSYYEVATELRKTAIDVFLGFDDSKKAFIKNAKSIKQKITMDFTKGLSKLDGILIEIKDMHTKITIQNQQLSLKYAKNYKELQLASKNIRFDIAKAAKELTVELEKHFVKVGGESIIETIPEFLILNQKMNKGRAGAKPLKVSEVDARNKMAVKSLQSKYSAPTEKDPKVLKEIVTILGVLYNKFSALQSLISQVLADQKAGIEEMTTVSGTDKTQISKRSKLIGNIQKP
jgi:hypothetical protein